MTSTFEMTAYRDSIIQVTAAVYETMLDVSVREARDGASLGEIAFTGAVYYAGSWKGALLLECSEMHALHWVARLMSLQPPLEAADLRDGLGELTNVISGNLKPVLPPGVGVSLPSVVQGKDYSLRICGENLTERLLFEDQHGTFRVTLVQMKNPQK